MVSYGIDKSARNYSSSEGPHFAKLSHHTVHEHRENIRVVTYNIQYAKRIKKAVALIEKNKNLNHADIICLQEMDEQGVDDIACFLKYNYIYYPAVRHPKHNRNFGNAILSKYPIVAHEKTILPYFDKRKLQRIAVSAMVNIGDCKIKVVCLHMKVFLKDIYRTMQVNRVMEIFSLGQKHCIIAGDFNTFTKKGYQASVNPLLESGFNLATHNLGWNYRHWYLLNKKSALDHIFTKGFEVLHTGQVLSRKASDHIPLWVELKI